MKADWWPLAQLRLATPWLELRLPDEADLDALASLAAEGVHDPQTQPFAVPWTDGSPAERWRPTRQLSPVELRSAFGSGEALRASSASGGLCSPREIGRAHV